MLFQREFHPPVTGRVDQATWDAIVRRYLSARKTLAAPLPLRGLPPGGFSAPPGAASVHLSLAQTMFQGLSALLTGLENSPATGLNDPATAHNLRWIQALSGQPQTGTLDQASWNTLARLYTLFVTYGQK